MKLLILLLSYIIHIFSIEMVQCSGGNQCGFSINNNGCIQMVIGGGAILCNPEITSGCPIGCKINNQNNGCEDNFYLRANNTGVLCPTSCKANDYKCYNYNKCNPTGFGYYCPETCIYNKEQQLCIPTSTYPCSATQYWKCPSGCYYNTNEYRCDPISTRNICKQYDHNCPNNCTYNPYTETCIPLTSINICSMSGTLLCPYNCMPNYATIQCSSQYSELCTTSLTPLCPQSCNYNNELNRCMPNSMNSICEPYTLYSCMDKYIFENTYALCTLYNQYNPCINIYGQLQYPTRLLTNNTEIICKYIDTSLDCSKMQYILKSCPFCSVNTTLNKCNRYPGIICGSYESVCPTNYLSNSECYNGGWQINKYPICEKDYILMNVSSTNGYIPRCFPLWFY